VLLCSFGQLNLQIEISPKVSDMKLAGLNANRSWISRIAQKKTNTVCSQITQISTETANTRCLTDFADYTDLNENTNPSQIGRIAQKQLIKFAHRLHRLHRSSQYSLLTDFADYTDLNENTNPSRIARI